MFQCLVKHGCSDLTSFLDMSQSSAVITSGGFGDVRRLVVDASTVVAIKTLRLHVLLKNNDKAVKVASLLGDLCFKLITLCTLACRARGVHVVPASARQRPGTAGNHCVSERTWYGVFVDGAGKSAAVHRSSPGGRPPPSCTCCPINERTYLTINIQCVQVATGVSYLHSVGMVRMLYSIYYRPSADTDLVRCTATSKR